MYCSNCGKEVVGGTAFCSSCGAKNEYQQGGQSDRKRVSIPVHMKKGLFTTDPYIIMVDQSDTAVIYIGKEHYNSIIASAKKGDDYFGAVSGMMNAFNNYAQSLCGEPIRKNAEEHQGSIVFDNGQVNKIKIYNEYNSGTEQYEDYETFELHAANQKFKGRVDFAGVSDKSFLKEVFGKRLK